MADNDEGDELLENLPTLRSQRRFLEVMSLISAVYYWFNIRINPDGSLLGLPVHIGSTRYALTALCIGLAWAAWRYGQQLYQARQGLTKDLHKDFKLELSRLANAVVRRYLSRMPLVERQAFGDERGKPYFEGLAVLERFNLERARRFDTQGNEVAPKLPRGSMAERSHSVILTEFYWMYEDAGGGFDFELGIGRFQAAWLLARAAIAAGFKRPAVFDYAAPVLLFLFAALSLVLAIIHSSVAPASTYDSIASIAKGCSGLNKLL